MNRIYYIDVGYVEDTVIYELVPTEVSRIELATIAEIKNKLSELNIQNVLIGSQHPQVADSLENTGRQIIRGKL